MKIYLLESYYGGSHKYWADNLLSKIPYDVELISLPPRNWKWRMEGSALFFAEKLKNRLKPEDILLISGLTNISLIKSLLAPLNVKVFSYFHENQYLYPRSSADTDLLYKRDFHYGFLQTTSALSSDTVIFNSNFNKNTFLAESRNIINKMPDANNFSVVDEIESKSKVIPIGIDDKIIQFSVDVNAKKNRILWNHRWEEDKNPNEFLQFIKRFQEHHSEFELVLLGDKNVEKIELDLNNHQIDRDRIVHIGYCDSRDEYIDLVHSCSVQLVTSQHDFFGLSVLEASALGVIPVLPKRLVYPEHFEEKFSDQFFYGSPQEAIVKLSNFVDIGEDNKLRSDLVNFLSERYNWKNIVGEYTRVLLHH